MAVDKTAIFLRFRRAYMKDFLRLIISTFIFTILIILFFRPYMIEAEKKMERFQEIHKLYGYD